MGKIRYNEPRYNENLSITNQILGPEATFYPDITELTKQVQVFWHTAPEISKVLFVLCLNHIEITIQKHCHCGKMM